MALTDTQKAAAHQYLGYSDGPRSTCCRLEDALDALSTEGEVVVKSLLTSCEVAGAGQPWLSPGA